MLDSLLLIEELAVGGGSSASLGGGMRGVASALGSAFGGVKPFANQNDLGQGLRGISDLTASIASAKAAMDDIAMRHGELENIGLHQERNFGLRDPGLKDQQAELQRQRIEHARQMQLQQQKLDDLQSRAALSLDPGLAARHARQTMFARAAAGYGVGQTVQAFGPGLLRGVTAADEVESLATFAGGQTNGAIASGMANTAFSGVSNVVGMGIKGASLGALAGPGGAAVGATLGTMAAVAKEAATLPKKLVDWGEALTESNRHLGRFSGPIAQANAMERLRETRRDIASAGATGNVIAGLSHSLDELKDELRPLRDGMTNILGERLTEAIETMTGLIPAIKELAAVIPHVPLTRGDFTKMGARLGAGKSPFEEPKPSQGTIEAAATAGAAAAFRRMKAEDISKPRQVPKR